MLCIALDPRDKIVSEIYIVLVLLKLQCGVEKINYHFKTWIYKWKLRTIPLSTYAGGWSEKSFLQ